MVAQVRYEVAIESPDVSTKELHPVGPTDSINANHLFLGAAGDTYSHELREVVVFLVLHVSCVCLHLHIGVECLEL